MKVSTMRWVDRWVGVPLCLFLSPFCWLSDTLRGAKRRPVDTNRTLFLELSEMGSALLVDPAMRKLQHEGKAELFFAIFSKNYKSLEILKTVPEKNVFKMNSDNFFSLVAEIFRFMAWCRQKKITAIIDLELFSRFTAILGFFSGARSRIGFTNFHDEGLYRGNLVNQKVRYKPHVHIAINFLSLVNKALRLFPTPYSWTQVSIEEIKLEKANVSDIETERVRSKIKTLYPEWND